MADVYERHVYVYTSTYMQARGLNRTIVGIRQFKKLIFLRSVILKLVCGVLPVWVALKFVLIEGIKKHNYYFIWWIYRMKHIFCIKLFSNLWNHPEVDMYIYRNISDTLESITVIYSVCILSYNKEYVFTTVDFLGIFVVGFISFISGYTSD